MIRVTIVYMDDKFVNLEMKEDNVARLLECIRNRDLYLHEEVNNGFWTDLDKIRHIITQELSEEKHETQQIDFMASEESTNTEPENMEKESS